MRNLLHLLAALTVLVLGIVAGMLGMAHWRIRSLRPPLPEAAAVEEAIAVGDPPIQLSWINTATQKTSRDSVLASSEDPNPTAPYVMSHPSFVLQWADGRALLVDSGMTREGAVSFGRPLEALGAGPIQPLVTAAEGLGDACRQVRGLIFTHLHSDHVGGIVDLCRCAGHSIQVFMNPNQARETNYTTSGSLELLKETDCVEIAELGGEGPVWTVPGFGGVAIAYAGGHTPDSQAVFARVGAGAGARRYAFAGDLVNNVDGILHQVPKPYVYSLLIVPEDRAQLALWRERLKQMGSEGYGLVVDHDQLSIESLGLPKFARP